MLRVYIINNIIKPIAARTGLWLAYLAICGYGYFVSDFSFPGEWIFTIAALGLFALPHALGDFYLIPWILNPPWGKKFSYWFVITIAYLIIALCLMGVWNLAPEFAITLMIAFVVWHFGSMDTYHIFPNRGISWVVASMGRGLIILATPFYFRPMETLDLLLRVSSLESSTMFNTLYSFSYYLIITGIALTLLAPAIHKFAEGNTLPNLVFPHWLETALLILAFKVAPPLLVGSFYVLIIHSIRQMKRIPPYIPERRGMFGEVTSGSRNVFIYYNRIKKPFILTLILFSTFVAYQFVTKNMSFSTITLSCFKPMSFLLLPHLLIAGLADFNPRNSQY